ncbi:hypothetical protein [Actinomadura sp. SCN-SB]|uniref:hypothetical protein n=1 Tax=Actinomadura sp. SCN-SB TaxID=3373092 RepID=UPI003750CC1E
MSDELATVVAYGYDLGGQATGWKVRETSFDGVLATDWAEDAEADELFEELPSFLPVLAGAADVHQYGDYEEPQYLLAVHVTEVRATQPISLVGLSRQQDTSAWDEELTAALQTLGLTPLQSAPAWLACAAYL